ncbi:MAG TPA: IS66 family transposase [Candidatus Tectomicrobia bacterium]|nr:IS66 family transposase [Candidatus Tectomicrobia bacterium]
MRSTSELAPRHEGSATPFAQQTVVLTKQAYIQLKWEAHYWRRQHERLVEREAALKAEVETLQATIRDLNQRLYGTKSEKSARPDSAGESKPASLRRRGQQPGSQGHGRSDRSALTVVAEVHDLSPAQACCPTCGEVFAPFPGTEESTILEVQVQAHLRRIQRRRYQKTCQCPQVPGIVTAPPAPRVIPKSPLGVSLWTTVLLDKYLYGRPTSRFCEQLKHHGVLLSQGTLTDGLQKIAVLFEPMMTKLYERQMGEKLFHGDETRWEVFEEVDGKTGHRWYLWVMQSASVVFYRMAPGRGADVLQGHFAKRRKDLVDVVLVCDRYSAYKCLAKDCDDLILAFCWAHVRRDFLKAARSWPECERWMFTWVEDIRELYRLNQARLEAWDETVPLAHQPLVFTECHQALTTQLSQMHARCEAHLHEPDLHLAKTKVLSSLRNHWAGLTVFVGRPEVAMDNNTAERTLRTPVVGRKNYYGSGSVWSAYLAARMFSVLQTVLLWGLNPYHWLSAFLQACADHGGTCPTDLRAFLPWQMTPERREALARPVPATLSPLTNQAQPGDAMAVVDTS